MSHSTRFLALALAGWVALRAVSLGMIPGGEALAFDRRASRAAALPALATTIFAPIEPVAPATLPVAAYGVYPQAYPIPYAVPVYAAGMSGARVVMAGRSAASVPVAHAWGPEEAAGYSLAPATARYGGGVIASGSSSPAPRAQSTPAMIRPTRVIPAIDRLSMSGWAMMRNDPGSPSLATNGQLGGSQAGTRLMWRFDRRFAASLRSSAPIGGVERNVELAAGLRWQPYARIPVALTAERRQSFGHDKSDSGFALFAEGGVYDRPILAGFNLDAYLQGGVVGISDPAAFIDGSATLTRPVWRQLSAGFGVWGGAQPGLARLDAGPRASLRLGRSMRVHLDYRHRFLGQAEPGSGAVLTLAGDF